MSEIDQETFTESELPMFLLRLRYCTVLLHYLKRFRFQLNNLVRDWTSTIVIEDTSSTPKIFIIGGLFVIPLLKVTYQFADLGGSTQCQLCSSS